MPRLLSSYAANKRVEDGLKRKQEQIRLDYIRATHRHLDETEKLVDDLININVRTPSAFELRTCTSVKSESFQSNSLSSQSAQPHLHNEHAIDGSRQNHDAIKDTGASERQTISSAGISPVNFRTELANAKAPGHPIIQIRGNEVFYQYQKQRQNWKKVEPSYKTKLLLHRNNTVIKALSHFNSRQDELHNSSFSEDCNILNSTSAKRKKSTFPEASRRESLFPRKGSRRESRLSYLSEDRNSVHEVVEFPPQLSPGHTPRMLDGWTIMKWCLWNKKQTTPVWATKRYAEMKNREYQEFIASKKRSEEQDLIGLKPNSANATHQKEQGKTESLTEENRLVSRRAKSVPIGRIKTTIDEETEHLPSIDRGVIRPTTSILRTSVSDNDAHTVEAKEPRPKTKPTRRVASDALSDSESDFNANANEKEDIEIISGVRKNSKLFGKSSNSDGKSVTIYAWDTLDETEKEISDEEDS